MDRETEQGRWLMDELRQRWEQIRKTIADACARVGRNPNEVRVVAVTKYVDLETTRAVLDAGIEDIGESRAQEAVPKFEALEGRGVWHFIGHLQRNKVKDVINRFTYIHSLDRYSLAKEIQSRAEKADKQVKCFIQVNVSGEESKHGIAPAELTDFAREVVETCPRIQVVGLMTMAPKTDQPEEVRPFFRRLKQLQVELQKLGDTRLHVPHLSMGMSQDYPIAVEEGATFLRLGSVLVGRQK
ncbi:YggS family pyridoxal phosphate-dependent enzyme [Polycladomyces zharkentensis]|nr:YggS family pyridoxal phosphate-dependent enzyme [Polycladomyces sp. WAk]